MPLIGSYNHSKYKTTLIRVVLFGVGGGGWWRGHAVSCGDFPRFKSQVVVNLFSNGQQVSKQEPQTD